MTDQRSAKAFLGLEGSEHTFDRVTIPAAGGTVFEVPGALPGETGVIDLRGFLQALDRLKYSGPVMVEPFSERVNAMSSRTLQMRATASISVAVASRRSPESSW